MTEIQDETDDPRIDERLRDMPTTIAVSSSSLRRTQSDWRLRQPTVNRQSAPPAVPEYQPDRGRRGRVPRP